MKLSKHGLIRIVEIVRLGLTEGRDISQMLRELDLVADERNELTPSDQTWSSGEVVRKPS